MISLTFKRVSMHLDVNIIQSICTPEYSVILYKLVTRTFISRWINMECANTVTVFTHTTYKLLNIIDTHNDLVHTHDMQVSS